ncbi:hypothetical protein HPB50_008868 [Hyalomma asiaticum]|uniref:Uncharacterized protein n=1 Tax=Hyalomma asiaticum TaxID=266040 RepID=A0ACB7SYZ5_HYAAI|nr:hypothetical protein HPB50_008868 [Hyalomma asiaticum]
MACMPIEIPLEAPTAGHPAKKRARSKPLRDEGLEELKSEFKEFKTDMREFQTELRNTLTFVGEAFSALSVRVGALQPAAGTGSSGSPVRDPSPSSGNSKARAS